MAGQDFTLSSGGGITKPLSYSAFNFVTPSINESASSQAGSNNNEMKNRVKRVAASFVRPFSFDDSALKKGYTVTAMIIPHMTGVRNGDSMRKHQPKMNTRTAILTTTSTDLLI